MLTAFLIGSSSNSIGTITNVQTSLYVSPASYTANSVGETIPVKVNVYMVFNMSAFQFQLRFNTTLLQCLNASAGSLIGASSKSNVTISIDNSEGIVTIQANVLRNGGSISGWGSLLDLNLKAAYGTLYPQPRDTSTIDLANDTLYDEKYQTIQHFSVSSVYAAPYASPQLNLTLNVGKSIYHYEQMIDISGMLTGNEYRIPDALTALEIQGPKGALVVARTFGNSVIAVPSPIRITELSTGNFTGDSLDSFSVGSLVLFKVSLRNSGLTALNVFVAVNPYDSSGASLGVSSIHVTVPAANNVSVMLGLPLQYDPDRFVATSPSSGNATVYASVWTDLVSNGGTALTSEYEGKFQITGSSQGNQSFMNPSPQETFQISPILHFKKGIYTLNVPPNYGINVATEYMGTRVTQSKQFEVTIGGDVNIDGKVTLPDLVQLAVAYGSSSGDSHWNPYADVNGDGSVNIQDLVLLSTNYLKGTA